MRRMFVVSGAVMALIACGAESGAAADAGAAIGNEGAGVDAATSNTANISQRSGTSPAALPIERGTYVSEHESGGCGGTTELFFYDGENIGEIATNIRNTPRGHFSSIERIVHVGPSRGVRLIPEFAAASRRFTLVWTTDQPDTGHPGGAEASAALAVRATGPGRFVRLRSTGGAGGNPTMEYHEEAYQHCGFAQLSPQMQAAVRDQRPQLAGAGAGAGSPAGTGNAASVPFPPIPQGYYARNRACPAVLAEAARGEPDDLFLFNQRGLRDFLGGTVVISGFEPLGGNRHRARARTFDENDNPTNADFIIAVTGAGSFTIEATADAPAERYTHCPDSQVSRRVREGYEF